MKKIIHIITNFEGVGGAELMLIKLINNMDDYEHEIISLINVSEKLKSNITKNVKITSFSCNNPIDLFFSVFKLKKTIKDDSIIISWMYHACIILGILKTLNLKNKCFFNIRHSLDSLSSEKLSTRLAIRLTSYFSNVMNGIIYCSDNAMKQHVAYGFSVKNNMYIPNGYLFLKKDEGIRKKEGIINIGALGRFHKDKNYDYLFKTFSKLLVKYKNINLIVGGKGVDFENLYIFDFIKRYEIPKSKIKLLGQINIDEVDVFYEKLDIFVLSSITEGFPNVLVEAMYNNLPVIGTDVGDVRVIIGEDEFIDSDFKSGLYDKISTLIDCGYSKRYFIGRKNKNRVIGKYDIKNITNKYRMFIEG